MEQNNTEPICGGIKSTMSIIDEILLHPNGSKLIDNAYAEKGSLTDVDLQQILNSLQCR